MHRVILNLKSNSNTSEAIKNKINEMEQEKIIYEDKIKSHTTYIIDLEKKVNQLIIEYEKTLAKNEELQ